MNYLILLLCGLGFIESANAQRPREITSEEWKTIREEVRQAVSEHFQGLKAKGAHHDVLKVSFETDTLRIERLMAKRLEIDYSTRGMVEASRDAEQGYDSLLNKYYNILIDNLEPADRATLRESQRNWLRFRDSERELNALLLRDKYSGGGSIQQVVGASGYLAITRKRVIELYHYLERMMKVEMN